MANTEIEPEGPVIQSSYQTLRYLKKKDGTMILQQKVPVMHKNEEEKSFRAKLWSTTQNWIDIPVVEE